MTAVNISGTFKRDSRPFCGLEAIAAELLDEKETMTTHLVVGEIRPAGYKFNADDGIKTPTVRFEHIEPVLTAEDAKTVNDILQRAYAARTGTNAPEPLPFDAEGWGNDEQGGTKK